MREHILEIYDIFVVDEELLRMLYYPSKYFGDSPLDPKHPNILDMDHLEVLEITDDVIKFTQNTDGFDNTEKCRICYYSGERFVQRNNKKSVFQDIQFDVLVHRSFQESDLRSERIISKIDEILKTSKFSSFGEVQELDGKPFNPGVKDYFGYKVIYRFGEFN